MGKKSKNEKLAGETAAATEATEVVAAAKESAAKSRGPRGVAEDAKISLLVPGNPKRAGSKAFAAFANYTDSMTVKAFADAVGADATGHLVYDAKHGFIAIDGYDPGAIVVAKPKKEKAVKPPKKVEGEAPEVAAEVQAETME